MRNDAVAKLTREITTLNPAGIAADLVRIPSYSDMASPEAEVCAYLMALLNGLGIAAETDEAAPGRFNMTARIEGCGTGGGADRNPRSLLLCGHTDTVPAYGMEQPLSGRIEDGVLHGRGAADMKGALAAMAAAIIALKSSRVAPAGDVFFSAVCDEEETGLGAARIVRNGPRTDGVIVGEPTSMIPCIGHKGLEWIRIRVLGRTTHGGNAAQGVNAISGASRLIRRIEDEYVPVLKSRSWPMLGPPTINVGRIRGGDQPSTVPGYCEILLDRRCVPSETTAQVYDELRALAAGLHADDTDFAAEIEPMEQNPPGGLEHRPFLTDADDPLVRTATAVRRILGIDTSHPAFPQTDGLAAFPAWTDAGFLANYTDSRCIVIGPGDLGVAHSSEERITAAEIEQAALFYALTAVEYCR